MVEKGGIAMIIHQRVKEFETLGLGMFVHLDRKSVV